MANGKMTANDIFKRIQRTFGDEAAIQVQADDVVRWINDAQREAVMQHENLLQATGYVNSVDGQIEYTGPADAFMINSMWYRDSDDPLSSTYALRFMAVAELNRLANGWLGTNDMGTSYPRYFTRGDDNNFKVWPAPNASRTNAFSISYSRYAVDLGSLSDNIDLPAYYHGMVEGFCMMRAYEMDEDWDGSDRKAQFVQSTIDANANREQWFGRETYPSISTEGQDYYG